MPPLILRQNRYGCAALFFHPLQIWQDGNCLLLKARAQGRLYLPLAHRHGAVGFFGVRIPVIFGRLAGAREMAPTGRRATDGVQILLGDKALGKP
ncbi:MAG: hypothetical protein DMG29_00280 [Acidobacteria bacterium]|nr:MAG: hypothetical protein DMG29_00280 [Acidobacteriota bacterium]